MDQVTLGKTGIKLSRLGIGTGSNSGRDQTALGKEGFTKLIHYAYDQGITYIDTAESYRTFEWISGAVKGLPREKLFIQSKVDGKPADVLAVIDHHRKVFNTDYIDSLLVHCMTRGQWTDEWKRIMDGFNEAQEKKWIRAKGVSCHSLPALRATTASDWAEVHPGARESAGHLHGWRGGGLEQQHPSRHLAGDAGDQNHAREGRRRDWHEDFRRRQFHRTRPTGKNPSASRWPSKDIDAIVIGFTSTQQIDEAIERMNRALAEV